MARPGRAGRRGAGSELYFSAADARALGFEKIPASETVSVKSELLYFWTAQPLELTPAAPESMKGLVPVVMVLGTDGTPEAVDRARTALDSSGVIATPAAPPRMYNCNHPADSSMGCQCWPISACSWLWPSPGSHSRWGQLGHPGPARVLGLMSLMGMPPSRLAADHRPGSSLPAPQRAGPLHRARLPECLAYGHRHRRQLSGGLAGTRILCRPRHKPLLACCAVVATFGLAPGRYSHRRTRCE